MPLVGSGFYKAQITQIPETGYTKSSSIKIYDYKYGKTKSWPIQNCWQTNPWKQQAPLAHNLLLPCDCGSRRTSTSPCVFKTKRIKRTKANDNSGSGKNGTAEAATLFDSPMKMRPNERPASDELERGIDGQDPNDSQSRRREERVAQPRRPFLHQPPTSKASSTRRGSGTRRRPEPTARRTCGATAANSQPPITRLSSRPIMHPPGP